MKITSCRYGISGRRIMKAICASRAKVIVAVCAMSIGSTAAFADAGWVTVCSSATFTAYGSAGTMMGYNPNGCTTATPDFVQLAGDSSANPSEWVKLSDGTVDIGAGTSIQMHQLMDMNGSKIQGLAPGELSASSTEAVNGAQLYATNLQVADNTAAINALSGAVNLVRQDPTTRAITVGKDTDGTVVDVTGTSGARQVTGVAAGALSADSTDAVNGSQLYQTNVQVDALNQRVQNISIGGTPVLASQANDAPASATGANATAIGNGAQATAANSVALGDRSVASEDNTVSVGSAGNERRVTNVAAGVRGTDAVNMNQLNALQNNVNAVAREAFAGVAAAMAMPNLTPNQPGRTVVAAGVANYKGYTAIGLGGTYRSENNRWLVNAAASVTPHGDTGVRGQVGYEF